MAIGFNKFYDLIAGPNNNLIFQRPVPMNKYLYL